MNRFTLALFASTLAGCAAIGSLLASPAGQSITAATFDVAGQLIANEMADRASQPEDKRDHSIVCIEMAMVDDGMDDGLVCHVSCLDQAANLLRLEFADRGMEPDTSRAVCFPADSVGKGLPDGQLCYVPADG